MDFISSKNIFLLTRDTLKLIDREIMKHGSRTGYIFYKLLLESGGYEKFELAEWVMLGTLHDIGSYKTNLSDEFVQYELKNVMPHSVYGYLFFKYLSPMSERSKVLLYHHLDASKLKNNPFTYIKETELLSLAEKVDIYRMTLGEKFELSLFERFRDSKFSSSSLELLQRAEEKYHIFDKIDGEEFEKELDHLMDYIMFTNEEKKKYMEMLMYCLGFRSQNQVVDSVTCVCICEELAKRLFLDEKTTEKLFYGALLHDLGMLAVPSEIIDAQRSLTADETAFVRKHVGISENILKNRLDEEVLGIALAHHERMDGTGYPQGLKENDMTLPMKILQVADTVTALINERSYKQISGKDDTISTLRKEVSLNRFSKQIVEPMIVSYDEIIQKVNYESGEILKMNHRMENQFHQVCEKYGIVNRC